jgi:hypothetical protein
VTPQTRHLVLSLALLIAATYPASAATHLFDLNGKAGFGLLAGNENSAVVGTPGSGGETGAGISYDDVTNILSMNFAWGSANGFTDLTGNATAGHIHGPTANSAPAGFLDNAGVNIFLSTLAQWNASASAGGLFGGSVTLNATQETELLAERYYINVHTSTNQGGEIRGHLVFAIPEPMTLALVGLTLLGLGVSHRRRSA